MGLKEAPRLGLANHQSFKQKFVLQDVLIHLFGVCLKQDLSIKPSKNSVE